MLVLQTINKSSAITYFLGNGISWFYTCTWQQYQRFHRKWSIIFAGLLSKSNFISSHKKILTWQFVTCITWSSTSVLSGWPLQRMHHYSCGDVTEHYHSQNHSHWKCKWYCHRMQKGSLARGSNAETHCMLGLGDGSHDFEVWVHPSGDSGRTRGEFSKHIRI